MTYHVSNIQLALHFAALVMLGYGIALAVTAIRGPRRRTQTWTSNRRVLAAAGSLLVIGAIALEAGLADLIDDIISASVSANVPEAELAD